MIPYHTLDADVIIVGGGLSGLATACALLKKESTLRILILEAADKVGGRLATEKLLIKNGEYGEFDLGAHWISSEQKALLDLINKFEIEIEMNVSRDGKIIVESEGQIYTEIRQYSLNFFTEMDKFELAIFMVKIETLCRQQSMDEELASMTMEQFLDEKVSSKYVRDLVKSMILLHCGIEAKNCTVEFYVFFCTSTYGIVNQLITSRKSHRDFWIKSGADEICKKIQESLHKEIKILVGTRADTIRTHPRDVEVETPYCSFYATNVVIAVPPSVIPEIEFIPPLSSEKSLILNNVIRGNLIKFVATYQEPFWKKKGLSGEVLVMDGYNPNQPLLHCYDVSDAKKSALSGYSLNCENAGIKILVQLSKYFGPFAQTPLAFVMKEWPTGSPMNCYRYAQDFWRFRHPDGRVFWAGAETSLDWFGHMQGAIHAANRAALEVIYDMRPASLTVDDMAYFMPNMSQVLKKTKSYHHFYKKAINNYQLVAVAGVLIALFIFWRRGGFSYANKLWYNTLINR